MTDKIAEIDDALAWIDNRLESCGTVLYMSAVDDPLDATQDMEWLIAEMRRTRSLLVDALAYLETLQDEGPSDEGWQSRDLQELENTIRRMLGQPERRIY